MKAILIIILPALLHSQPFTRGIFGQNYWEYPNNMNENNSYVVQHIIGGSEAKVLRVGGIHFNKNTINPQTLAQIVVQIKAQNMLPIVTIPVGEKSQGKSIQSSISNAIGILTALNSSGTSQSTPFTRYFIIGNEPDLDDLTGSNWAYTPTEIFNYTSQIIAAMKSHQATLNSAVTLQFLGPELSSYRNGPDNGQPNGSPGPYDDYVDKLSKSSNATCLTVGNSKVDFFTFHYYATFDQDSIDQWTLDTLRSNLLQTITTPLLSKNGQKTIAPLKSNLTQLQTNLGNNPSGTGKRIGITEANICTSNGPNDGLSGTGANGFLAGQFWSEIISVGLEKDIDLINFWSAQEGDPGAIPV